jgi:hypothetical protein
MSIRSNTKQGSVLQVSLGAAHFSGCLVIVDEVHEWGVRRRRLGTARMGRPRLYLPPAHVVTERRPCHCMATHRGRQILLRRSR